MKGRKPFISISADPSDSLASAPTPPKYLDKTAKEKWNEVCGELLELNALRAGSLTLIAMLCDSWSRWVECTQLARQEGYVLEGEEGGTYQNPTLSVANKSLEHVNKLASELGISPTSRSKLTSGSSGSAKTRFPPRRRA